MKVSSILVQSTNEVSLLVLGKVWFQSILSLKSIFLWNMAIFISSVVMCWRLCLRHCMAGFETNWPHWLYPAQFLRPTSHLRYETSYSLCFATNYSPHQQPWPKLTMAPRGEFASMESRGWLPYFGKPKRPAASLLVSSMTRLSFMDGKVCLCSASFHSSAKYYPDTLLVIPKEAYCVADWPETRFAVKDP